MQGDGLVGTNPISGLVLGGRQNGFQRSTAEHGEYLFYSEALASDDRQAVEAYLRDKWFTPGPVADFNGDGSVDAADAQIMFANWSNSGEGDLNGDNTVDAADAQIMFEQWTGEPPAAGDRDATAEYNVNGQLMINANGVVNVFVEHAGGALVPGGTADAPAGLLKSDNASRVGLTGFGGINVSGWGGNIGAGHAKDDLSLVVGPAVGCRVGYVPSRFGQLYLCARAEFAGALHDRAAWAARAAKGIVPGKA